MVPPDVQALLSRVVEGACYHVALAVTGFQKYGGTTSDNPPGRSHDGNVIGKKVSLVEEVCGVDNSPVGARRNQGTPNRSSRDRVNT